MRESEREIEDRREEKGEGETKGTRRRGAAGWRYILFIEPTLG